MYYVEFICCASVLSIALELMAHSVTHSEPEVEFTFLKIDCNCRVRQKKRWKQKCAARSSLGFCSLPFVVHWITRTGLPVVMYVLENGAHR